MQPVKRLHRTTSVQLRLLLWTVGIIAFLLALRFMWPQEQPRDEKIIDFAEAERKLKRSPTTWQKRG